MGSKYEVQYWDYHASPAGIPIRFNSFRKAKRAAKKLCKRMFKIRRDWYCVTIMVSEIKR